MIGTLASCFGGFIVGLSYYLTLKIFYEYNSIPLLSPAYLIIIIGALAGFVGSLIDSVLGGFLQYSGINEKTCKISNEPGDDIKHISGYNLLSNFARLCRC